MKTTIKKIGKRYNRFSTIYDFVETPIEKKYFSKWRKKLLSNIKGKVLEVGVGTGKNLPYYNHNRVELTAIDISGGMLKKAEKKAEKINFKVKFKVVGSEKFTFPDNSFDYIVATFVLCSVADQQTVLSEMKRVLKKEGRILLLEHVLSKNRLMALFQWLHNPFTRSLFGFNINRDTLGTIKKSRLQIITEKNLAWRDVFKMIEMKKTKKSSTKFI
ncbi:MAG: class I SAM-dependent methyltransferase [Nanoarchaeota archaeon]|nr:class I SAM-dependent methyltransferase [Nanoarchaeota archaeon]MBU1622580.1 class I SAM-dependent methyltransferase [Nanoarchaeota archaeon]MBU1974357.1 class I SAM-dependent methyltransferase [Nanoarchaeota archaeon]